MVGVRQQREIILVDAFEVNVFWLLSGPMAYLLATGSAVVGRNSEAYCAVPATTRTTPVTSNIATSIRSGTVLSVAWPTGRILRSTATCARGFSRKIGRAKSERLARGERTLL